MGNREQGSNDGSLGGHGLAWSGTFSNGSTQINPASGVWWFGAGIDVTILTFSGTVSTDQPRCVLKGNSRWQDLTLSCSEASNSATAGASIGQDNDISNLLLSRIKIVAALDCITFNRLSSFFRNVRIEHCFLFSTYDGLQLAASQTAPGGEIEIRNSTIICVTTDANKFGKCVICQTSNARYVATCLDSIFISDTSGGSAQSRAISIDGAHEFDFVGGSVRSVGNSPLDFSLANNPVVRVSNTFIFDANKVTGGTILYAPLQSL